MPRTARAAAYTPHQVQTKGLYGDTWVLVTSGPKGLAKLVSAHKAGKPFPETPPPPKPHKH